MSCCEWIKNLCKRRDYEDMGGSENEIHTTKHQIKQYEERIRNLECRLVEEMEAKEKAVRSKEEALRSKTIRVSNSCDQIHPEIDHGPNYLLRLSADATSRERVTKNIKLKNLPFRLSEHIAVKLGEENPNIVDLSDVNRPDCLAEKFSQLYDDKWTNAFELIKESKGYDEDKEAIKLLLDILMECYRLCREKSSTQMKLIVKACNINEEELSTTSKKVIKEIRKKIAPESLSNIQQETRIDLGRRDNRFVDLLNEEEIQSYVDCCSELCWLMAVQDPPMALSTDTGADGQFDRNKYREYTNSGHFVDYIVWPSVLIQDGGMLISKGVAQCCDNLNTANIVTRNEK